MPGLVSVVLSRHQLGCFLSPFVEGRIPESVDEWTPGGVSLALAILLGYISPAENDDSSHFCSPQGPRASMLPCPFVEGRMSESADEWIPKGDLPLAMFGGTHLSSREWMIRLVSAVSSHRL